MRKFLILCLMGMGLHGAMISAKEAAYTPKDFSAILQMSDWNQDLLQMHLSLYQGYVKNTNLLLDQLAFLNEKGQSRSYEFGALKRRLAWEYDGMRLHELYFQNLTKSPKSKIDVTFLEKIQESFGSLEAWRQDFISTGLTRGIGWVILYKDPISKRLFNTWINEHDVGHLSGGQPLVVMDVFEHAYITQFGLDRAKYIDLFFQNLNWEVVNERWLSTELPSFTNLKSN